MDTSEDFHFVDVQWTVVFDASAKEALALMRRNALTREWRFDARVFDQASKELSADQVWPSETLAECTYEPVQGQVRTLFWSATHNGTTTMIVGGLYLSQFARAGDEFADVARRAVGELRQLVSDESMKCLVLTSEDDDLTTGPSILGFYRTEVWQHVAPPEPTHLVISACDFDCVEVKPRIATRVSVNVSSLPDRTRRAVYDVQNALDELLSPTSS